MRCSCQILISFYVFSVFHCICYSVDNMLFIEYFFPRKYSELRVRANIVIRIRSIVIRIQISETRIRTIIPITASEREALYMLPKLTKN